MSRKLVVAWVLALLFATVPTAAATDGGGLTSSVCVNLAVLLALTITPVETLVDAFRGALPSADK